MKLRTALAGVALGTGLITAVAAPAQADHTKGKKYFDLELTREAAIEAGDNFGPAPENTSGAGAMYLNAGQERFCLFLDFEVPDGVQIVALHLHEKAPGAQNGPVAIDVTSRLAADGRSSSGCVAGPRETLRDLLSDPDEYYINAHTNQDLTVVRTELGHN
jgi:hypothetical protein